MCIINVYLVCLYLVLSNILVMIKEQFKDFHGIALLFFRKKVSSSTKENKPTGKKVSSNNSVSGSSWKSIFSKPRHGSYKKSRKGSGQGIDMDAIQLKIIK